MFIWLVNFLWFFIRGFCLILDFIGRILEGLLMMLIFLLVIFIFREIFLLDILDDIWFNLVFFLFECGVLFLEDCLEGDFEVLV